MFPSGGFPPVRPCRLAAVFGLICAASCLPALEIVADAELQINEYTPGFQGAADVAVDAEGNALVLWQSAQDGSLDSIHARGLDRFGAFRGVSLQVNSYSEDNQIFPKVASDAAGNFVVVWQSFGSPADDGSNFSIQGQVFGASGSRSGGQFQANTFTLNGQTLPAVAAGPAGQYVVVWRSRSSEGSDNSGWSIRGRRFPAGADVQVNDVVFGDQNRPAVAMGADGGFVVVWESPSSAGDDASGLSIQGRRFAATGLPVGPQFQVNDWVDGAQERPAVAIAPDGTFVVAWGSATSSGNDLSGSIQARRFDALGQPLGPQQQVNGAVVADLQSAPDIAWIGGPVPGFVLVWDSVEPSTGSTIRARRFGPDLQPIGDELLVNAEEGGDQTFPSVSADAGGNFVVTWYSSTSPEDALHAVRARRFRSTSVILADGFEGAGAPGDRLDVGCTTNALSRCDDPGRTLVSDPSMLACRAILGTEGGAKDVTREVEWSATGALGGSEVFAGGTILTPAGAAGTGTITARFGALTGQDVLAVATQWVLDSIHLVFPDGQPVPESMQFPTGLGYGLKLQARYADGNGGACVTDVTGLADIDSDTPSVCELDMPPSPHLGFGGVGPCMLRLGYAGFESTLEIAGSTDMPMAFSAELDSPDAAEPVVPGDSFGLFAHIFGGLPARNLDVSGAVSVESSNPWVGRIGLRYGFFDPPGLTPSPRFVAESPGDTVFGSVLQEFFSSYAASVTQDCLDAVDLWIDARPGPVSAVPGEALEAMVIGTFESGNVRELELLSEVWLHESGTLLPELQTLAAPHLFHVTGLNGPTTLELVAESVASLRCDDATRPVDSVEIQIGTAQVEMFEVTLEPPLGDGILRLPQRTRAGGAVTYDDGRKRIDPPTIEWISDDPAAATVVQDPSSEEHGSIEGRAPGTASIIGELSGFSAGIVIPVSNEVPARIEIQALKTSLNPDLECWLPTDSNGYTSLDNDARYWTGTDAQVKVLAYYTGDPVPREVTDDAFFTTSDPDLAIVLNAAERGTVEIKRATSGPVTFTALFGGLQDSIVVDIESSPVGEPRTVGFVRLLESRGLLPIPVLGQGGSGQRAQAIAADAICYPPATFSSDDAGIAAVVPSLGRSASVDGSPRLSGRAWIHPVSTGATTIRVKVGGLETLVPVEVVDDTLASVRVEPANATLSSGAMRQLRAIATLSGGGETELTWSHYGTWSTTAAVTSVDPWGVVFALDVAANGVDTVDFCHPDGDGATVCASTVGAAGAVTVTPP